MNIKLRDYQQECVDTLDMKGNGSYLVQMATGLGKTVTFANLKRKGRVLILSHREELVKQPLKYFECSTGIEMASQHSNGEEVVSASVQSIVHRLDRFSPTDFDLIIVDEAHHSAAKTYRKVLDYFNARQTVERAADTPSSWIKNIEIVNLWAQEQQYNLHDINFFQMPDGRLICSLPEKRKLIIPCPDELGNVLYDGTQMDMQSAIDKVYRELSDNYSDSEYIWNLEKAKIWGRYPASEAQVKLIKRKCKNEEIDFDSLTKLQASQILNRIMGG